MRSNFQIILLSVFGFFAVLAVIIFSGILPIGTGNNEITGEVLIWGTIREEAIGPLLDDFGNKNKNIRITYIKKNPATFDKEFIEALASGRGPDLFFLPQDFILKYEDKILPIPYAMISERDFKNTYIEEGELYLAAGGILGLPIIVDPMVMYWNRDIFSSAAIATPPSYWDEFLTEAPLLTKKDNAQNITRSAVALGEFRNISYAKDILATLLLQLGNKLVVRDSDGKLKAVFMEVTNQEIRTAETVFRFFTQFSDPAKPAYSWNRSLPSSKQNFISERLAVYFGYASEILELRDKNPHLNFDVAGMPQPRENNTKLNFGRMEAMAVTRISKNPAVALAVASYMSDKDFALRLADKLYLPPARRDLLSAKPQDPYLRIFYDSALTSRGWLDPTPETTNQIFGEAVSGITGGKHRVSEAIGVASSELEKVLQ